MLLHNQIPGDYHDNVHDANDDDEDDDVDDDVEIPPESTGNSPAFTFLVPIASEAKEGEEA